MAMVSGPAPVVPTNLAPLPRLVAYAHSLGLEGFLDRPTRGIATLSLALLWLTLAWRGSGRPDHGDRWEDPLLAALLGRPGLPCARTLRRSLARFSAKGVRAAVETAYRAELPRRTGRVWVSVASHQVPYWGRGKKTRFHTGWAGNHGRARRGYRLFLVIDTARAGRATMGGRGVATASSWPSIPLPARASPSSWPTAAPATPS